MEWFQRVQLRRLDEARWKWRITEVDGKHRAVSDGELLVDEDGHPSPAAEVPITVLCALAFGQRNGPVDEIDHRTDLPPVEQAAAPTGRQPLLHRIDREPWGPGTLAERAARARGEDT